MTPHTHLVRIYYEDTDLSGVVYHANYLRYFERAREHLLGPDTLVALLRDQGIGFVVYRVTDLVFHDGATLGDELEVRIVARIESEWRVAFDQSVWRPGGTRALVRGQVELACVDAHRKLVPLPKEVVLRFPRAGTA